MVENKLIVHVTENTLLFVFFFFLIKKEKKVNSDVIYASIIQNIDSDELKLA